jgi:hypothetical protein
MSQTEELLRRFSPSEFEYPGRKYRGIEDEDDDEYENDTRRTSGSSSLPSPESLPGKLQI